MDNQNLENQIAAASAPVSDSVDAGLANSPFNRVPIEIMVSVGKARPLISELITLNKDSVLPLDRRIDDPVELYVGERLIARGNLMELDGNQAGQLAVCLTEVAELNKGL
jgi:flagellar motor switch protein FliN